MIKFTREETIVEVDLGSDNIDLKVYRLLTWDEWDQLKQAIDSKREWHVIRVGRIIPGDKIGFLDAAPGDFGKNVQSYAGIVKRKLPPGWIPVNEGRSQVGDKCWLDGWKLVESSLPVHDTAAVIRRV